MDIITLLVIFHLATAICLMWPVVAPLYDLSKQTSPDVAIRAFVFIMFLSLIPVYNVYTLTTTQGYAVHGRKADDSDDGEE